MTSSLVLGPADPRYPGALCALSPAPTLRVRGELPTGPAIAIVGTRQPSPEAARYAYALAADLARSGVVVWSGGATGIDDHAHHGALSADGLTVLVAGGGLDRVYPVSARPLWQRIVDEQRGALVSLVDDTHPPAAWTLLRRNGALAALADAVVLIEAPLQSGARSTTAAARRLGRPVWVAGQPPWSPFAPTVREEVRLGAKLLLHVDELLASLDLPPARVMLETSPAPQLSLDLTSPRRESASAPTSPPNTPPSRLPARAPATPASARSGTRTLREQILDAVSDGHAQLDELCEALQTPAHVVLVEATGLLLDGSIHEVSPGIFSTQPSQGQR